MYITVGMRDVTSFIAPDSEENGSAQSGGISFSASLNDPASTCSFLLDDIHQTLNIQNFMPVVIWDENAPPIPGSVVPTVPAWNFALNPSLVNDGLGHAPANWSQVGTLPAAVWSYPQDAVVLTVNNNTNAQYALQTQMLAPGYIVAGQSYMLSVYMTGSGTIAGFQTLLELTFFDSNGNSLTPVVIDQRTPLLGQNRIAISGVAPAGAVSAQIAFGGIITSATNSGSVTFGAIQCEPMWFADKGVSYPTPDCNFAQVNSVLLPDGTTSRKCRLFAGYVEDHINVYVGQQRHTAVQCASSSKLLETAGLISASFTNTQDTTILSTALSQLPAQSSIIAQLSTGQQNQFSPSSTLVPGVIVDSISFNDATMREVSNGVSAQSGSLFYVDPYYYFWYVPPSFVGTVVELSDTPDNVTSFPYDTFSIEYDSTNPINYCRVKGTKQKAAAITDTFSGNGSTTIFNLSEPPENVHSVTVGGSSVRTGVDGVDNAKFGSSSTFRALINKQKQTIQFATAPASGSNNVVVSYTYEDQVIADVIAADAIAEQQAQFWGLVSDSNITSTTAAKHRGLTEVQDYAEPRIILTLSALNIYLPVGSLILFTCQSEGLIRAPFVVQTVDIDPQGGGVIHWNYTAGVYNPTLLDHIRNVHKAVKKTPTTANVVVVASIDAALFDEIHLSDQVTATPGFTSYSATVLNDGPLAYYRLTERAGSIAYDTSGHDLNGTLNGTITKLQPGLLTPDTDTALLFDGSTGYIQLPNSGGWPSGNGAWSLECWCKPTSSTNTNNGHLVTIGNPGTNSAVGAICQTSTGGWGIVTWGGAGHDFQGNGTSTAGTVYYLVATYDGAGTLYLYVSSGGTTTTYGPFNPGTLNLSASHQSIGDSWNGSAQRLFFNGTIEKVAIYSYALSSAQVTAHYAKGH